MVVEVLVAERDGKHALTHQRCNLVLDQILPPLVMEARREPPDQPNRSICRPQQQRACIRRNQAGINAASKGRPSTIPKSKHSALHSVGIGVLSRVARKSL